MCIMIQAVLVYLYFLLRNAAPTPRAIEDHLHPYPCDFHEHACNYDKSESLVSTLRAKLYLRRFFDLGYLCSLSGQNGQM